MAKGTRFELSTARVSRLLRPLRLKCSVLASSSSTFEPIPRTGFAEGSSLPTQHDSLLSIIPPPERLRALFKLDRASRANIELSKKLYDVRDAFRNVIQAVHVPVPSQRTPAVTQLQRIRSLTSLCAATVGEHMEEQVRLARAEREEDTVDNDDLDIINELYEAVPEHYRKCVTFPFTLPYIHTETYRCALVSHALSIVFSTCPPNHTLFSILLEVTVSYGLRTESEAILYHLLKAALDPRPNDSSSSPIVLPSHSNYLRTIRDNVSVGGVINDRAFVRTLCSVLEGVPASARPAVWTCQAVIRLARRFRSQDYESFIYMCHRLCEDITTTSSSVKGKERENSLQTKVHDRLAKWLEALCERVITTLDSSTNTTGNAAELWSITELLHTAQNLRLHVTTGHTDTSKAIADALLCLATLCAASPQISAPPLHNSLPVSPILYDYHGADIDTFNSITTIVLSPISKANDLCHLILLVNTSRTSLERWASRLRSERFYLLEAWFWSNILAHVESMCSDISSTSDAAAHGSAFVDELEKLRREIVPKIEQAERMHFAHERSTSCVGQTPSKAASKIRGSEFRWEELVGCWILKTPLPVKKRGTLKRQCSPEERDAAEGGAEVSALDEHVAKRPRMFETPLRPRATSMISTRSTSTDVSPRSNVSPSLTTSSTEPENLELEAARLPSAHRDLRRAQVNRRRSGFTSILADAGTNRVVLHERAAMVLPEEDKRNRKDTPCLPADSHPPRVPIKSNVGLTYNAEPSSDDLDLLAYHSSEW